MPRGWVKPPSRGGGKKTAPRIPRGYHFLTIPIVAPPKAKGRGRRAKAPPLPTPAPRPKQQTRQYRGAAVLRRGTFFGQLAEQHAYEKHGPSKAQRQSLEMLRAPDWHLKKASKDQQHAARLLRAANPGPVLQSIINQNPRLKRNQDRVNKELLHPDHPHGFWHALGKRVDWNAVHKVTHVIDHPLGAIERSYRHPINWDNVHQLGHEGGAIFRHYTMQGDKKQRAKDMKTLHEAGIISTPKKGILGTLQRGVQDIQDAALYSPYGLYGAGRAAATDEWRMIHGKGPTEVPKLAKQMGEATLQDIQHPLRHPGNLALDAYAIASLGAGSAARLGAAGEAFSAAARTGEGTAALSRGVRAALLRPSAKGGSLIRKPAPRESQLIWRGALNEDRQLQLGGHSHGEPVTIPRLEPDNPLLKYGHRWRNKVLQQQLDTIASGGKLHDVTNNVVVRELLGMHAPTVVGREARALKRVHPDLGDTIEAQIPRDWIKPGKAGPRGELAAKARKFTNQFRFFGVYLGPKYVTTNYLGNALMGVSTQGVAKIAANMYRARRMVKTHGEDLTHAIEHDAGISRTESYMPEAIRGEEGAGLTHTGKITHFQDRYTKKMMDLTDRDFRKASWQYRAREAGFDTPQKQHELIYDPKNARKRADVARRTRKDAVDFDSLTPAEKHMVEVVFFYPWMSRASVWTARTVLNRPAKAAVMTALAQQGKQMSGQELGDQPQWMKGYIRTPFGVVNPKSVLASTTPGDIIQQGKAVAATMAGKRKGDPQSFFQEFGTPPAEILSGGVTGPQLLQTTLPASTYVRAGSPFGKIPLPGFEPPKTFPKTGAKEAILPAFLGGLAPRRAKGEVYHAQAKRERMLQSTPFQHIGMRKAERIKQIPAQVKLLRKLGGVSKSDIARYKGDLDALELRDEYRLKFAQDKGKSSYRQLKPRDKAEAALQFLHDHSHVPATTVNEYRRELKGASKQDLSYYANALWDMSGIGQVKSDWDANVKAAGG